MDFVNHPYINYFHYIRYFLTLYYHINDIFIHLFFIIIYVIILCFIFMDLMMFDCFIVVISEFIVVAMIGVVREGLWDFDYFTYIYLTLIYY